MPIEGCIGEIRMFAGNFAPRSWALCNGQLLPINQNQALFSIIGTIYGGDGESTFGLPDLRGRMAMHPGNGPGLTPRQLGQNGGSENVTLTTAQMPLHNHAATTNIIAEASSAEGNSAQPEDRIPAKSGSGDPDWADPNVADVELSSQMFTANTSIQNSGGNQPHDNVPPFKCVNYIICLFGTYPTPD